MALKPVAVSATDLLQLHAAHPERYPVLLQSAALGTELSRYDILLAHPQAQLKLRGDGTLISSRPCQASTFLGALDELWSVERTSESTPETPFSGGWFAFLGYELAGEIEPKLRLPRDPGRSIAQALRIPAAIVVRHADASAWIVVEAEYEALSQHIVADIETLRTVRTTAAAPSQLLDGVLEEENPQRYLGIIAKALDHIADGDIYQANLSRCWSGRVATGVAPHQIYARLRETNPAPFAALVTLDDRSIVSSTPERLIEIRNGVVASRPIAGTRPRSQDRLDDAKQLSELRAHPKERAEHIMLIDLERNDLGRICEAGTVEVDEFMVLESYAHVHHIVSNVRGKLRADVLPGQALAAVFPGGTITGCPKVRCMELIAALEGEPRGAYTGSIGYINRDGSMDFNILIRTLDIFDGQVRLRAGGGIVADSIPEHELEETRAKARGLIRAFE